MNIDYQSFIEQKTQIGTFDGFDPLWMPDFLYDFQSHLVDWSLRKGRAAIFADCGLGKTPMQLTWAQNVVQKTNRPVLILTPLAVGQQTVSEAEKFGIEAVRSRDGSIPGGARIVVTNYEKLHMFDAADFAGCVCDESSILKNYAGATRNEIINFIAPVQYRLLCTATPSPNDYTELGNSVESLSIMRRVEMLAQFFIHDSGDTGKWRLKGHANDPFWRFVASWARAIRSPSDLGFDDDRFILPPMELTQSVLPSNPRNGDLFPMMAVGLDDQRAERRETISHRCEEVAQIANSHDRPFLAWCSLNDESARLTELIDGAAEITGSHSDDEKERRVSAFVAGDIRAIVTKPKICGFGMNWQHCADMSFFPSHSHEQYYQCVRRCHRFGQEKTVNVHIVTTESESAVMNNLMRKERDAIRLFKMITDNMKSFYEYRSTTYEPKKAMEMPAWIKSA